MKRVVVASPYYLLTVVRYKIEIAVQVPAKSKRCEQGGHYSGPLLATNSASPRNSFRHPCSPPNYIPHLFILQSRVGRDRPASTPGPQITRLTFLQPFKDRIK